MEKEITRIIEQTLSEKMGYAKVKVSNLVLKYDITVVSTEEKPQKSYTSTEQPKRKYKKRKFRRTGQFSLNRDYTTSPEDIKVMRTFIGGWQRQGGIIPDKYDAFLNRTRGKFSVNFSNNEKCDILNIFNDVRRSVLASGNGKI